MLIAHLVPGYFVVAESQKGWNPQWKTYQRAILWAAGIGSTFAPDLDVVYNALFRNFFNHSTLWTHSLLVYLAVGLVWLILQRTKRWPYINILAGLITIGGTSHLALDVVAHGTPLLYPLSMMIFGVAPQRVIDGGVWAYLTDPIFLLEPLFLAVAAIHWTYHQRILSGQQERVARLVIIIGTISLMAAFILCLPLLQQAVLPLLPA